ncbi:hypothetical protein BGZ46_009749 [Entomortierella lignicola]|nr:hypothetical protein BGZ46_009749 [Entomortierella lignicola]
MVTRNPLEISEILFKIGLYFKRPKLVNCLLVCRTWHKILLPYVWKTVIIVEETNGFRPRGPSSESLLRHLDLIVNLDLFCSQLDFNPTTFPNLRTLKLSQYYPKSNYGTELVTLCPSLTDVSVTVLNGKPTDTSFWRALSNLSGLKIIRIRYVGLFRDEMNAFWDVCSKVEEAHFDSMEFHGGYLLPSNLSFPRMRTITFFPALGAGCANQIKFLCQCPNLEEIQWLSSLDEHSIDAFANYIEQGTWPRLERLRYKKIKSDAISKCFLDGIRQITSLNVSDSQFGPFSFDVLRRHFNTITRLLFVNCPSMTSSMIQEILSSCPNLVEFSGGYIMAKHIVEGRPWVCLSIKQLQVCIGFSESEQDLQFLVFEQLSKLVRLETLGIGTRDSYSEEEWKRQLLDLRLSSGLGQLSQLKHLKMIAIRNSKQAMEYEDIRWLISNWGWLDIVDGKLNQNAEINSQLEAMLEERGGVDGN